MGVILAVTGSAVGLGNFLRFPGLAAKYEGGAFMIPYFIALLLLGLPIAWAEWAMGRYGGVRGFNSTPGIFRVIWRSNPLAPYLGVLGLIVPVMIYMYYVFIEAWCLGYAYYYITGELSLGSDPAAYGGFFSQFVGNSEMGQAFSSPVTMVCLAACVFLNFFIIYFGVSRGIERFNLAAMPLLVLCAIIIVFYILSLGTPDPAKPDQNVWGGLGFMWNPGTAQMPFWQALANGEMWLEAAGQIFFSLSVGFGVVITYSSYLRQRDDIALSSTTAVAGNEWCEVALGGLMTIPAAFIFLGSAATLAAAEEGTFSLGFQTLPLVFDQMPLGRIFGFLFFFLLFLAAVTSSISMLQPAIAFLEEGTGLQRRGSVVLLGLITVLGTGFVVYFNKGFAALDTLDFWVGTFCIYVLATIQVIIFGWVLGAQRGLAELDTGAEIRIPRVAGFVLTYISPAYLLIIFGVWFWQNFQTRIEAITSDRHVAMTVGFILLMIAFFLLLIQLAVKRWDKIEREVTSS
jgi:SNF family Na+-dependent transporter